VGHGFVNPRKLTLGIYASLREGSEGPNEEAGCFSLSAKKTVKPPLF